MGATPFPSRLAELPIDAELVSLAEQALKHLAGQMDVSTGNADGYQDFPTRAEAGHPRFDPPRHLIAQPGNVGLLNQLRILRDANRLLQTNLPEQD